MPSHLFSGTFWLVRPLPGVLACGDQQKRSSQIFSLIRDESRLTNLWGSFGSYVPPPQVWLSKKQWALRKWNTSWKVRGPAIGKDLWPWRKSLGQLAGWPWAYHCHFLGLSNPLINWEHLARFPGALIVRGASQVMLVVKTSPAKARDSGDPGTHSIPGSRTSSRVENGNPLQYSCLGNSMDRGAWRATAHRVAQSWTWLKQLSTLACTHNLSTGSTVEGDKNRWKSG